MTFALGLTETDNLWRSICGAYIQIPSLLGAVEGGVTGRRYELPPAKESSGNYISSEGGLGLTLSFTNSIILEPIGCGLVEKQLYEKMKRNTQRFLMRSLENSFENFGKLSRELSYETKEKANQPEPSGHRVTYMRGS
jgi:hypothetical protein